MSITCSSRRTLARLARRLRPVGLGIAVCGALCGVQAGYNAQRARAAVLIALDLPALVDQSDLIVIGHASKQSARYVDKLIVTDVTLEVITSLKGDRKPGDLVTVTHLGGAVGDVGLHVPGAASFKLGQSALVFLRRAPDGDWNVTGMSQGVLPITGQGSEQQVHSGGAGATLMQPNDQGQLIEATPAAPSSRSLSELLAEIERLVRER